MKTLDLALLVIQSDNFKGRMRDSLNMITEKANGDDIYLALISLNGALLNNSFSSRLSHTVYNVLGRTKEREMEISLDLLFTLVGKKDVGIDNIGKEDIENIVSISKKLSSSLGSEHSRVASIVLCRILDNDRFGPEELASLTSTISKAEPKDILFMLRGNASGRELPDENQISLDLFRNEKV